MKIGLLVLLGLTFATSATAAEKSALETFSENFILALADLQRAETTLSVDRGDGFSHRMRSAHAKTAYERALRRLEPYFTDSDERMGMATAYFRDAVSGLMAAADMKQRMSEWGDQADHSDKEGAASMFQDYIGTTNEASKRLDGAVMGLIATWISFDRAAEDGMRSALTIDERRRLVNLLDSQFPEARFYKQIVLRPGIRQFALNVRGKLMSLAETKDKKLNEAPMSLALEQSACALDVVANAVDSDEDLFSLWQTHAKGPASSMSDARWRMHLILYEAFAKQETSTARCSELMKGSNALALAATKVARRLQADKAADVRMLKRSVVNDKPLSPAARSALSKHAGVVRERGAAMQNDVRALTAAVQAALSLDKGEQLALQQVAAARLQTQREESLPLRQIARTGLAVPLPAAGSR
jgi:hypothetical protein